MKHIIQHVENLRSKVQERYLNRTEEYSSSEVRFIHGQVDAYTKVVSFLQDLDTESDKENLLADKMRELSEKNKLVSHEGTIKVVTTKIQVAAENGLRECSYGYLAREVIDYFLQQGFTIKELDQNHRTVVVFKW